MSRLVHNDTWLVHNDNWHWKWKRWHRNVWDEIDPILWMILKCSVYYIVLIFRVYIKKYLPDSSKLISLG